MQFLHALCRDAINALYKNMLKDKIKGNSIKV